jgi:RimJ/RimL family protein N-acetyltransferase
MILELQNDKVILREFTTENLNDPSYFSWLRDLDIVQTIYRLEYLMPIQFSEVESYVNSVLQSKNDAFFAVYDRESNKFIGTLKVGHINWRSGIADLGIIIGDKAFQGKGLSKEIISVACNYCFNVLSLRKLTAGTPSSNLPMINCFKKIGFQIEGTLIDHLLIRGKFEDHILFGLFKENFSYKN